jgi:phospholipid/cholesterol/gamma-HCH transport system substrate-binding protein
MNNGNGALSKLITDEKFANSLTKTLTNLQTGSKGLSENMEAAKHNFLLRFFNKKQKRREET